MKRANFIKIKMAVLLVAICCIAMSNLAAAIKMPTHIIVNKDLLKEAVMRSILSHYQNITLTNSKKLKITASLVSSGARR